MANQDEIQTNGKIDSDKTQIMIVDDEKNILNLMKLALQNTGHKVAVCSDAESAIEELKKESYDLVITDLMMPKLSGTEFVKKAKEISPETDLVVMTGYPSVETAVKCMKLGAIDYIAKPLDLEYINIIVERSIYKRDLEKRAAERVTEIRVLEETLDSLKYDSLTGLYTRRTFDDMFLRETDRAARYGLELSVLFLDIDDFKVINDTFGHLAGDETLKHVARIIISELRTIDIAVRYGGEEIVVVLPETGKIDAFVVGERIRESVENTKFDYKDQNISLTISGGIASFPIDATDTENLIKNSDIAVYRAKETGKNNIVIFSEHKRRYIRVDFIAGIQVQIVDPNNKIGTLETTSKDLSAGGILFESKYPIYIDTKVQLWIPTGTADEPLVVTGDVVRIEKFSSGKYDIGISFLGVNNAARSELSKCIRKCIEERE